MCHRVDDTLDTTREFQRQLMWDYGRVVFLVYMLTQLTSVRAYMCVSFVCAGSFRSLLLSNNDDDYAGSSTAADRCVHVLSLSAHP